MASTSELRLAREGGSGGRATDAVAANRDGIVRVDHPDQVLGALWRGWRLGAPVVIDGRSGWPTGPDLKSRIARLACRMTKPVVLVDSAAQRARLGSIPSALIPDDDPTDPTAPGAALEEIYRRVRGHGAPRFLAVNGRYRSRPVTGVERVARGVVDHALGPVAVFAPVTSTGPWDGGPCSGNKRCCPCACGPTVPGSGAPATSVRCWYVTRS